MLKPLPHAPEIRLYVADEVTGLWHKTEEDLARIGLAPPFWAFAWAGGLGLARYILDHPELVRGKRVLDFAAGSGLVAIAAMMAGAMQIKQQTKYPRNRIEKTGINYYFIKYIKNMEYFELQINCTELKEGGIQK